jgi:predicted MFS family arabinose efflux permease
MQDAVAVRGAGTQARARWGVVAALAAGACAVGTASFVVAGVLPGLARDLGVRPGAAGLTVTAFAAASALGGPVLGALVPARRAAALVAALVAFAGCNVVAALAPSLPVLLVARVAAALAAVVYVPRAGAAAVAAVPDARRGRALAVVLGGGSASMLLGAPLGVALAELYSWRAAFLLVAVLAVVAAGALAGAAGRSLAVEPPGAGPLRVRLRPLRSAPVAGSLVVTVLLMTGSNSAYTYVSALFADGRAAGLGLLIALFGAGGVVGTWCGGAAADRWGAPATVWAAAAVLTAVFAAWPLAYAAPAGALGLVAGWAVAGWASVPAQQHLLVGLAPRSAPLVLALNGSAINLGFALGSLGGGLVLDVAGAQRLWAFATTCCAAGLAVQTALVRRRA